MSDPRLDQLAESARNRRLKLVRSRVRTPGKRRFGKVGLTDAAGKPVLGMDAKGPIGTPEEVEAYLRTLDARDWGASLDVAAPARKRTTRKAPPPPANDAPGRRPKPKKEPKSAPPPAPKIREAKASDVPRLVQLIEYLGHEIDEKTVRRNLAALKKSGEIPLVVTLGKQVAGTCGIGVRTVIHRPAPLGRISALVVAKEAQGHGIGRMLVEAAEQRCRERGCQLVEVTSNDRLAEAHAFYRHMGYERTSIRFVKKL